MYNMISYKSKAMHVEDDIINLSPIRQKINPYPRKENNCGDDSSMVLLYDGHLSDTIISGDTYLSGNGIVEIRDLVLSSLRSGLHNGDAKYRIYSRKTETVTNITIQK